MEHRTRCEHRWRYFVHIESRAIRIKECERCGWRSVVPTRLEPLPRRTPAARGRS
ncbi:MAG: hypothetical protein ACM3S1_12800 [Hyphomicrobiales bacterium]